jgi:translation initiation factor IF-2
MTRDIATPTRMTRDIATPTPSRSPGAPPTPPPPMATAVAQRANAARCHGHKGHNHVHHLVGGGGVAQAATREPCSGAPHPPAGPRAQPGSNVAAHNAPRPASHSKARRPGPGSPRDAPGVTARERGAGAQRRGRGDAPERGGVPVDVGRGRGCQWWGRGWRLEWESGWGGGQGWCRPGGQGRDGVPHLGQGRGCGGGSGGGCGGGCGGGQGQGWEGADDLREPHTTTGRARARGASAQGAHPGSS